MFIRNMKADNDNEPLSFITLAAATANVVRYLEPNKQKNEQREQDPAPGNENEKKRSERGAYVEKRLSDLAAFERRARGLGKD